MRVKNLSVRGAMLFAAGLVALGQTSAMADNLLSNGNFEAGNTGFSTGYNYSPGNLWAEGSYDVVSNPHNDHSLAGSYGDHTSGSGLMLALNGDASYSGVVAWSETVAVTPDNMYQFNGWDSSWSQGYGPVATLDLAINGNEISEPFDSPVTQGVWTPFAGAWFSGEATSATITITDLQLAPGGNDFALDDLSFTELPRLQVEGTPTPAPAVAGIVGFGIVGALKLRRRYAKTA